MGNTWSSGAENTLDPSPSHVDGVTREAEEEKFKDEDMEGFYERRKRERDLEMARFKKELDEKRRLRREALGSLSREMKELREERERREELEKEAEGERRRREELEKELEEERRRREELEKELGEERRKREELELAAEDNAQRLKTTDELERQVAALKDVANIGKQILAIREKQVNELNKKLKAVEETGTEYEKEVEKVKRLKSLYEEREEARESEHRVELERERARTRVAETKLALARQDVLDLTQANTGLTGTNQELAQKVSKLSEDAEEGRAAVRELRLEVATRQEEAYHAESRLGLVNSLFAGLVEGHSREVDRLARLIEENRPLLKDLTAKGRIHQVASVLMDLALPEDAHPTAQQPSQDLKHNLTKVWGVMVELLSHHKWSGEDGVPESCYKSVETPRGTRQVISPSQTFIRLKDLILEKNSLVKEVGRLKVLNNHLESRLGEQEQRLSLVTSELHKTWAVVNKLQSEHKQLHTQERILRYELQHKRQVLTAMKKELETCREQWQEARAKNSKTEQDWKLLREEFASRKKQVGGSTESGYDEEEEEDHQSPEERAEEEVLRDIVLNGPQLVTDEEQHPPGERAEEQVLGVVDRPQVVTAEEHEGKGEERLELREHTVPTPQPICSEEDEPPKNRDEEEVLKEEVLHEAEIEPSKTTEEQLSVETESEEKDRSKRQNESIESEFKEEDEQSPEERAEEQVLREIVLHGPKLVSDEALEAEQPLEEVVEEQPLRDTVTCGPQLISDKQQPSQEITEEDREGRRRRIAEDIKQRLERLESRKEVEARPEEEAGPSRVEEREVKERQHPEEWLGRLEVIREENEEENAADRLREPEEMPSTSSQGEPAPKAERSTEEILRARDERLKRLEEQCKSLFTQMSNTSVRSEVISNKLEELHQIYGEGEPSSAQQPNPDDTTSEI